MIGTHRDKEGGQGKDTEEMRQECDQYKNARRNQFINPFRTLVADPTC